MRKLWPCKVSKKPWTLSEISKPWDNFKSKQSLFFAFLIKSNHQWTPHMKIHVKNFMLTKSPPWSTLTLTDYGQNDCFALLAQLINFSLKPMIDYSNKSSWNHKEAMDEVSPQNSQEILIKSKTLIWPICEEQSRPSFKTLTPHQFLHQSPNQDTSNMWRIKWLQNQDLINPQTLQANTKSLALIRNVIDLKKSMQSSNLNELMTSNEMAWDIRNPGTWLDQPWLK